MPTSEGKGVLPEFHGMRKGLLTQKEETGSRAYTLPEKWRKGG